jgi:hypothetical protein
MGWSFRKPALRLIRSGGAGPIVQSDSTPMLACCTAAIRLSDSRGRKPPQSDRGRRAGPMPKAIIATASVH